jgi:mRNA-degrading endonuclease RelE of RelBE toxin-antitoxin system
MILMHNDFVDEMEKHDHTLKEKIWSTIRKLNNRPPGGSPKIESVKQFSDVLKCRVYGKYRLLFKKEGANYLLLSVWDHEGR